MGCFCVQWENGGNSTTFPYPIIGWGGIYIKLTRVARSLNIHPTVFTQDRTQDFQEWFFRGIRGLIEPIPNFLFNIFYL